MPLHTDTTITIGKTKLTDFEHLTLSQSTGGHHRLEVQVGQHWWSGAGGSLYHQVKDLIGETLYLQITPKGSGGEQLEFRGVVTGLATGKGNRGLNGTCRITAASPTLLMDDHPHTQAWADQSISHMARRLLSNYPQNLLRPQIRPTHMAPIPYTVQYAENTWQFLQRLAARWGEWFFYDGMELVLGRYDGAQCTLSHEHNLEAFELGMQMRPTGQTLHGYEYRGDQSVQSEVSAQSNGSLGEVSAHVLKKSDSLYGRKALRRVNQPLSSAASREVRQMATLQRKSDIVGMVTLSGQSTSLGLGPGRIAKINETLDGRVEYGRYFITEITHHCNAAGDYSNRFTGLPEDTAHPPFQLGRTAWAEPQSATVTDNHDPKGLGRIRVQFRWQQGGMSPWLRLISAAGGGDKGFYMIPEKGEEVMVDFEGGNPERPYVLGTTYNGGAKTSYGNKNNDVKAIATRSGAMFMINDAAKSMEMKDPSGGHVKLNGDKTLSITAPKRIELSADEVVIRSGSKIALGTGSKMKPGAASLVLETGPESAKLMAKKKIAMLSKKDFSITATEKSTHASKEFQLSVKEKLTGSGKEVNLAGGNVTKISGGKVEINKG